MQPEDEREQIPGERHAHDRRAEAGDDALGRVQRSREPGRERQPEQQGRDREQGAGQRRQIQLGTHMWFSQVE